jgi:hypothetical protein
MSTLVEGIEAIPSASRREAGREDVLAPHDPARVGEAVAEVEPARRIGATSAAARSEVLVGHPEFEAMTGDGAGGDRDMTFAGSGSCLLHRFRALLVTKVKGASGWTATQPAGSRWVTTTTGTFMVCRRS